MWRLTLSKPHTLATVLLLSCPAFCAAEATRFYPIPNSRSPRGAYELVYGMKNGHKVDWEELAHLDVDPEELLGKDDENVEVLVMRKRDARVVQRLQGIPYWRAHRRTGAPAVTWAADERSIFIYIQGYWTPLIAHVARLESPAVGSSADVRPLLKRRLDAYMQRHFPKHINENGYRYTFNVEKSRFRPDNHLELSIRAYFPKAASDWTAEGRVVIDTGNLAKKLRPVVTGVVLTQDQPGSGNGRGSR